MSDEIALVPRDPQPFMQGGLVAVLNPTGAARGAIILHQGHAAFDAPTYEPANLKPVAETFRAAGFAVYGFEMPPGDHDLDRGPLERFYHPVVRALNALPSQLPVCMVGLSGGGWTTSVVTALNSRIVRGYSVAGDAPLDVWSLPDGSPGRDWEQLQVDYRALYAQAGARLVHIYNFHDPCCFWGIMGETGYVYVTDSSQVAHTISPWTIDYILQDIGRIERDLIRSATARPKESSSLTLRASLAYRNIDREMPRRLQTFARVDDGARHSVRIIR